MYWCSEQEILHGIHAGNADFQMMSKLKDFKNKRQGTQGEESQVQSMEEQVTGQQRLTTTRISQFVRTAGSNIAPALLKEQFLIIDIRKQHFVVLSSDLDSRRELENRFGQRTQEVLDRLIRNTFPQAALWAWTRVINEPQYVWLHLLGPATPESIVSLSWYRSQRTSMVAAAPGNHDVLMRMPLAALEGGGEGLELYNDERQQWEQR